VAEIECGRVRRGVSCGFADAEHEKGKLRSRRSSPLIS
jgi:hypothetical protein